MKARNGFTLVEVMIAVVITALVVAATAAALEASLDFRQRLEARRDVLRSRLAWRTVITSALRNVRPATSPDDTTFLLVDETRADGVPSDRLVVLTAGTFPPLNPGVDWIVSLGPSQDGVHLTASPPGIMSVPVRMRAPSAMAGVQVHVLREAGGAWESEWHDPAARPMAVRLQFWTADGPSGEAWTVWLPPVEPGP
ncbi:MAG: prepilin-type N-terminal cleavage/methylation domain-containing protein [Gemmatimonadota bacterium]